MTPYLIEIKEENFSNTFFITVNENLYFKILVIFPTSSSEGFIVLTSEEYILLIPIPETE